MMRGASLSIAVCLLLAGCDGGLQFTGVVLTPDGKPVANAPVYMYREGAVDHYDPVLWTDTAGRFELNRLDCTCDFQITLVAARGDYAPAYLATTHKTLERERKTPLVLRLGAAPRMPPQATPALPKGIP